MNVFMDYLNDFVEILKFCLAFLSSLGFGGQLVILALNVVFLALGLHVLFSRILDI